IAQTLQPNHRPNEERREREGQQTVGNGAAAGQLLFRALLVDVNPLLVAGRFRELVDSLLRDLDPVACADLSADGGFDLVEGAEDTHARLPGQIFISGTASGITSSASVTATTSATLTPGAVSSRVALP